LLDRLDDVRAFTERSITADVRDVIQVNIDREPSETEVEEVECRATLQDQLAFQERMFVEFDEQLAQARNFFEIVGEKSGVTGESCDLCGVSCSHRVFARRGKSFGHHKLPSRDPVVPGSFVSQVSNARWEIA